MTQTYETSLSLLEPADADERTRELMERGRMAAGGMLPNLYRAMAHSPALFQAYLDGYELFRKHTRFSPVEQEVVFLTISFENGCAYCMAAHSTLADLAARVPREITAALRAGEELPDPKLRALSVMTRAAWATRGRPTRADVDAFVTAGYDEAQLLDVFLAIAVKTISNYTNHVFETPVDEPFRARAWPSLDAQK